ncbi:MAG: hypothetical protein N3A38_11345, partial [Planctomycetota bacterium]|nr:hypothetical protein [Planctomycetota bacterium]
MPVREYFVVCVMGSDRPGIVEEVSRIIAGLRCNIEDSRMAHLGGEFGLLMLCSGDGNSPREAGDAVKAWAAKNGMICAIRPTTAPARTPEPVAEIGLRMPDRQGIVNRVAKFLADRGANVEALESDVRPAPFSGIPVFSMRVVVRPGAVSYTHL